MCLLAAIEIIIEINNITIADFFVIIGLKCIVRLIKPNLYTLYISELLVFKGRALRVQK